MAGLSQPISPGVRDAGVSGGSLSVLPALSGLFPYGSLQRGTAVSVAGSLGCSGALSMAMAVVAGPSAGGCWTAIVGVVDLGFAAAAAMGVAPDRTAVVPEVSSGSWAMVVGAFIDAFDIVVVAPAHDPGAADVRRLRARMRERGAVLIDVSGRRLDVDLHLAVTASRWSGLDRGHGHLRSRRVSVVSVGRGVASRPSQVDLLLPGPDGGVEVSVPRIDEWREDQHGGAHARGVVS